MVFLSISIGYNLRDVFDVKSIFRSELNVSGDYLIDCQNLSIEDTAYCMTSFVSEFYNFTIRSDVERDLEDIKLFGEDCFGWASLYIRMAEELGFSGNVELHYNPNKTLGHSYAKIYNSNLDYCILDNKRVVGCAELKS